MCCGHRGFGEGPEVLGVLLQATCCLQAGRWSWGGLRKQAWLRKQARTVNVVTLAQQNLPCRFVAVHLQLLVEQKSEENLSVRTDLIQKYTRVTSSSACFSPKNLHAAKHQCNDRST